jgi:hypothetical protein
MHRTIQGYLDMGRPAVPPLPNFFVLTARDNGVQYVLTFTGTAPALTFALSTTLPTTPDVTYYGAYAGPYVASGTRRLFVTGGALASEALAAGDLPVQQGKVLARRGVETTVMEVTFVSGALAYANYDL